MNHECLKLTSYFGERQRVAADAGVRQGFLADGLLNLFGAHEIATSVMMRGIASFGPRHVLRTDQSLSLSEDPPVTIAAVDVAPKIRGLVDDVVAMTDRGLVTLERARLAGTDPVLDADDRDAGKLTVYVGRQEHIGGLPAYRAVCALLHRHGFAGAAAFLGVDGTAHGHRYRARFFSRNVNVPMMIIAVGTAAQVSAAAAELGTVVPHPLLTVERVRLCKRDGESLARPHRLPTIDQHGRAVWQKLMVHTSEAATRGGVPIHRALVRALLESGLTRGTTVLRGVWGFHADQQPRGDRLFQLARGVPAVTIIIDRPEWIVRSFDVVDELTAEHGVVTSEMVPAALSLEGPERLGGTRLAQFDY